MDKYVELKKTKVLQAAINWWSDEPESKDASFGAYVCDACGGPIREKEGTSLLGNWMRCRNCTERMFRNWDDKEKRDLSREIRDRVDASSHGTSTDKELEMCFHCRTRPADEKSPHIVSLVPKEKSLISDDDNNTVKSVTIPCCKPCKQYGEWGDRFFGLVLPFIISIVFAMLITHTVWLIVLLVLIFFIPLAMVSFKLVELVKPSWKDAKVEDVKKHPGVSSLIKKGWKIRRTIFKKIISAR